MRHSDALQVSRGKAFIFCCVVTSGKLTDIVIRYYSGQLIDSGIGREEFMSALLGITAICGINLLLQYLGPYAGDRFEALYTGTLFSKLEDKILYSKQEQIDKRTVGEFSTCFSSDVYGILQFVKRALQVLVPDIISFVVCKMYGMCIGLGLYEEIRSLENGYDTILQEKGAPLSGGQKKRIAFIRSVLHEAEVYIFDEPTVSVDRENSIRMMEYISMLAEQHYVIMITHNREMMDRYPGTVHDIERNTLSTALI